MSHLASALQWGSRGVLASGPARSAAMVLMRGFSASIAISTSTLRIKHAVPSKPIQAADAAETSEVPSNLRHRLDKPELKRHRAERMERKTHKKPTKHALVKSDITETEARPHETRRLEVTLDEHHARLDHFLTNHLGLRKNVVRLKILNEEVKVVGSTHARFMEIKPDAKLHAGDRVEVLMPLTRKQRAKKMTAKEKQDFQKILDDKVEKLKESILFKDEHVLVINKPDDLPVQGGSKTGINLTMLLEGLRMDAEEAPRLVHRLDKNTTGAFVLARTKLAATRLIRMFEMDDAVEKTYWAITVSAPKANDDEHGASGSITTGIVTVGDPPNEKQKTIEWHETESEPTPLPSGIMPQKAVTEWKVLASYKSGPTWIELKPKTGRKHQLRVHCASILNAHILGDYKYGAGCPTSLAGMFKKKSTPMHLHLRRLVIKSWFGVGADLEVTAKPVDHFRQTLERLGQPTTSL
ncbi:pseudouridine synthase [Polychytrium aggregatum]|uniref:pseudouridine synthase n=1 Tax=Polychytrium aggregatum TaxID=110093 RepID=UPI0022FE3B80|nr:pseudouridine synthase [Polychytrium aggregatum]KAI9207270.1 pseudouridine synthase [Polychytrium aggregatum]